MTIPKELNRLNDDLVIAFYEFEEYSIIFRESEARINLLNKVAPNFFVKVKDMFWSNFIMTVSRFTDQSNQSYNQNLSLKTLLKYKHELNESDQNYFNSKLKIIENEARNIRKFRSKYISHRDLDYALLDKNDIEEIELLKIENIYKLFEECLNIFNLHFSNRTIFFRDLRTFHGASSLVHYLKNGVIYEEFKIRRKDYLLNEKEINLSKHKDA